MTDTLLLFGLSNLLIAALIAALALAVQRSGDRPYLAHWLWLLVLLKLVSPPLFNLPLPVFSNVRPEAPQAIESVTSEPLNMSPVDTQLSSEFKLEASTKPAPALWPSMKLALLCAWALGSVFVLCWSVWQIGRFHRRLLQSSEPAPAALQEQARDMAAALGLRRCPELILTTARISPMLWWLGGPLRVVLPKDYVQAASPQTTQWVMAHELAHIARRDHWVRLLEWLVCVAFWWNPVAWWARRNLRIQEEICCDATVLETLSVDRHQYGHSLLSVLEFLSSPALRPPAMASGLNSGGTLERRFLMIVSQGSLNRAPRWLRGLCVLSLCFLPLGVAQAQSPDYEAVGKRLVKAVQKGELSAQQARAMMGELAREHFSQQLAKAQEKHNKKHDKKHSEKQNKKNKKKSKKAHKSLIKGFQKWGLDMEDLGKVKAYLREMGIPDKRMETAFEVLLKMTYGLKKKGADHKDKDMVHWLLKNGFNKRQVEGLYGVAKRIVLGAEGRMKRKKTGVHLEAFAKKLKKMVAAGKLTEKEAREKWNWAQKKAASKASGQSPKQAWRNALWKLGATKPMIQGIEKALSQLDVGEKQRVAVMNMFAKAVWVKVKGKGGDLEWYERGLKEVGLKGRQLDRVWNLTKRVSNALAKKHAEGHSKSKHEHERRQKIERQQRRIVELKKEAEALQRKAEVIRMEAMKRKLEAIAHKLEAAVRAGKLSKEQARDQLKRARKEMSRSASGRRDRGQDEPRRERKRRSRQSW